MDFFFYDPFDDLSKIQSHLAQLQREMDATQQKRRSNRSGNSEISTEQKEEPCAVAENTLSVWWPAVDVRETEGAYELYVELPGVKKEDVKIELHREGSGKCLIVSGKKERIVPAADRMEDGEEEEEEEKEKKEEEKKKKEYEKWHRTERVYGRFERAFSVPVETEGDEIKAKFENGVLIVTLPKHEAVKAPAKVAIQID